MYNQFWLIGLGILWGLNLGVVIFGYGNWVNWVAVVMLTGAMILKLM